MKVMVIGAGIGGLATALSLQAAGIDVEVFESVKVIQPLGLGINLQPNAVRELIELGFEDALAGIGIATSTLAYYNKHGQKIWSEPRGLAAGYRWPQYAIHRGELQRLLLDAVYARLGSDRVHLGSHLASVEQDERRVVGRFVDRISGEAIGSCEADALVAADGVHSTVRRFFNPDEGLPVSSGRIMWRGALLSKPYLDGRTQVMIGHRDQRAVVYPMSEKSAPPGMQLINWLVILGEQGPEHRLEDWDLVVRKERFFPAFASWNFPWIKLADMISATDEIFEYPKADREPLHRWTVGRITLLGDAAHPMRPIGSQAGTQAIVDARVLAQTLFESGSDVCAGLQRYDDIRRPLMNEIVLRNRNFGPEVVMQMAEERAPGGFADIEDVISRQELEDVATSFKVAAGFDPQTLNNRPSHSVPSRANPHTRRQ
jgi:2-polyprenyl-6-methoxyphenol hydroxylase-like FAD-dependent oxidoreductase